MQKLEKVNQNYITEEKKHDNYITEEKKHDFLSNLTLKVNHYTMCVIFHIKYPHIAIYRHVYIYTHIFIYMYIYTHISMYI